MKNQYELILKEEGWFIKDNETGNVFNDKQTISLILDKLKVIEGCI